MKLNKHDDYTTEEFNGWDIVCRVATCHGWAMVLNNNSDTYEIGTLFFGLDTWRTAKTVPYGLNPGDDRKAFQTAMQELCRIADKDNDWQESDEACPGCRRRPGDGVNEKCNHPEGCGYWKSQ